MKTFVTEVSTEIVDFKLCFNKCLNVQLNKVFGRKFPKCVIQLLQFSVKISKDSHSISLIFANEER